MKKFSLIFVLLITSTICFAQNTDLKFYVDSKNGYQGYAGAMYLDDFIKEDISGYEGEYFELFNNKIADKLTPISKLTKNNNWLFRKAMNEWDYEINEMYAVLCADSLFSKTGVLIVILVKGKDDFLWKAYTINEGDLKSAFDD